jgi:hypothetical protein
MTLARITIRSHGIVGGITEKKAPTAMRIGRRLSCCSNQFSSPVRCNQNVVVVAVAGNNLEPYHSPGMSSNPKTNEWNLLKEGFDGLVRNDVVREDSLEQPKLSSSSYQKEDTPWAIKTGSQAAFSRIILVCCK